MKHYILTEKIMYGTVTTNVAFYFVEAQDWEEAKSIVTSNLEDTVPITDGKEFIYSIPQNEFCVYGNMKDEEIKYLRKRK